MAVRQSAEIGSARRSSRWTVTQQVATLFDDFRDRMHETAVMLDEEGKVAGS